MAQSSSAAREPSMEEILASIRRIIEDSDVIRQPVVTGKPELRGEVKAFPRAVPQDADPVDDLSAETADAPEAMLDDHFDDAEFDAAVEDAEELVNPYRSPANAVSESEVKFAISHNEFVMALQNASSDFAAKSEQPAAIASESDDLASEAVAWAEPAAIDDGDVLVAEAAEETFVAAHAEPADVHHHVEEVAMPADSHKPNDLTREAASADSMRPILSGVTEKLVASAFQDLNHAVQAEQRQSFDKLAADIMRPMLAEWMDANLPNLVERLVREEITRIVRGEK